MLGQVIEATGTQISERKPLSRYLTFPSNEYERKFKFCLSKSPSFACINFDDKLSTVSVRPKHVQVFESICRSHGLGTCEVVQDIVKMLYRDDKLFLRFEAVR